MTILPRRIRGTRLVIAAVIPAVLAVVFACTTISRAAEPKSEETFAFHQGDHICFIGNTLPDRMQHDGWLETLLQSRFPKQDLSFRDLGFSGDEVEGFTDRPDANKRQRSDAFGSSDDWLTRTKADVIFAFFGYNESFAGDGGPRQVQKRPRRDDQAHALPEVQRQDGPASGALLAHRP